MGRVRAAVALAAWSAFVVACGDDSEDGACSVRESDAGVTISCSDGTISTIPRTQVLPDGAVVGGGCTISRQTNSATIVCGNAPPVVVPTFPLDLDGGSLDGGARFCAVTQSDAGIAINCPDGTNVVIPGEELPPLQSLKVVGATTASCGTCHDSDRARAHFAVMTVNGAEELPIETCGTCHNEGSIKPVSAAHARPEYAAPGLRVALGVPTIDGTTRKPTVRLTMTEAASSTAIPNRTGMSVSFVLSKVESVVSATGPTVAGPYRSLISRSATQAETSAYPLDGGAPRVVSQPAAESSTSGKWAEVGAPGSGVWDYTFNYALPADYDATATYALAVYATRTVGSVRYVANATSFFVPGSPSAVAAPRNIVNTATCNNCHNPLQAHGGSRQEVQLCLTCHTQGAVDPESGNSIDFNVMIHRIHTGKALPSVIAGKPYSIVGNGLTVHDWSHAGFPQPVANCQVCHTASDSDRWVTNAQHDSCVSCHDNIEQPGAHPIPLQPTTRCGNSNCHAPTAEAVARDAIEAHAIPLSTPSTVVFDVKLLSVTATVDSAPVVRFSAYTGTRATGAGPVDGGAPLGTPVASSDALSLLEVFVNGPNSGYTRNGNTLIHFSKGQLTGLAAAPATPGEFTFSLPMTTRELLGLSSDDGLDDADPSQRSYTLSLRAQYDPTPGTTPDNDRVDMQRNPTAAFTPAGTLRARTPIVSTELCNRCHGELSAHGGSNLAKNVEQCAMCHTGSLDTRVRQGANKIAGPTTSLRLSTLVHRIHGTELATAPYRVFGFSATGAPFPSVDLSEIGFPGDSQVCTTCHLAGSYFLPLPEDDPPSRTVQLDSNGAVIGTP